MNLRLFTVPGLILAALALGIVVGRFGIPAPAKAAPTVERPTVPARPAPEMIAQELQAAGAPSPAAFPEDANNQFPGTPEASVPAPIREVTATHFEVTRVIDGDTFRVEYDGDLTSVRLLDIDAPERGDPRAAAATQELRRLVDGKTVRLEFGSARKRDGFGRLLCTVYLDDLNVCQHLLDLGLVEKYQPGPRKSKTP